MDIDQAQALCGPRSAGSASARGHWGERWRGSALAVATLLLLAACSKGSDAPASAAKPVPEVGVVTLKPQSQQIDASLPGRTRAFMTAEVRPQVSGIVQKRLFTEGAQVKQGQPLYQIDAASLQATEASAVAALAKAEASLRTLTATARRNAELVKIDAISQQVYEEGQASVIQARSDVGVAKASLDTARINLKYSRIEAPIGGRIALSTVTPGALVTANQTTALTTIVQMDPMYVDFTQSSTELVQLKRDIDAGRFAKVEGDKIAVRIRLDDGSDYPHQGRLAYAGVIVNDSTGTLTLRALVPNPDGLLMPGMYVQALLPTALAADALLLPQQSVTRDLTGRPSVLVAQADGVLEKRDVELNRALGATWLVQAGLQPGERVMVDGFQRAKPGDKVKPVEVDMKAKAERQSKPGLPPVQAAADAPAAASSATNAKPAQ
ncbi:efflux RND transporter periplasmic adaptor subunit [Comamonas sp. GB3 AK4-5]|uniref:efflux RND transporter periplasmic adaptor subunit n=1 Tax=Comamonas sp. GB3 AK4-5 TaxID=3231487 RepID=UPI00351ED962